MAIHIGRREFIKSIGGAAVWWPAAAREQEPAMPLVGFLGAASAPADAFRVTPFRRGLEEAGYAEGRNVAIEYRHAEDHYDRLPEMAADLVRRQVSVIAASGGPAAMAAKAATKTIPIVFAIGLDPVETGLVATLNRPGGNLTGVTTLEAELEPKRLELLHELVPTARTVALLVNPANKNAERTSKGVAAAARSLGITLQVLRVSGDRDLDPAFGELVPLGAGGLIISADTYFNSRSEQFAALAARHQVPAIFQFRQFVAAGGLMAYGVGSTAESYRLAGVYTGRILKGEKPDDLPVQQATKLELFINLKTAKALGLTLPTALLLRADEVIE